MLIRLFLVGGLVALSNASPLSHFARGCTEGLFNCLDGRTYQQCVAGGTWSVTMQVAPGTTCQIGISANPWALTSPVSVASAAVVSQPISPTVISTPTPAATSIATTTLTSQSSLASTSSVISAQPSTSSPQAAQNPSTGSSEGSSSCVDIKSIDDWLTWDEMKQKYTSVLGTSCQSSWQVANNSPDETQAVFNAIEANHGTVDPRFVLAIVVQESSGCVRVVTTNNGVRNPGLMQDSNGSHSCNEGGVVQNPCPTVQVSYLPLILLKLTFSR